MPFLLAEILNFQGSAHLIGVGSLSKLIKESKPKKKGLDNKLKEDQLELEMADRILDIVDSKSE